MQAFRIVSDVWCVGIQMCPKSKATSVCQGMFRSDHSYETHQVDDSASTEAVKYEKEESNDEVSISVIGVPSSDEL